MKSFSRHILTLCAALLPLAFACNPDAPYNYPGLKSVSYQGTDAVIANPERGFYSAAEIYSATHPVISSVSLTANRKQGRTIFLLEFHLTDYVNSDIAEDYLTLIRKDFQTLRDCGAKCILRFCYSNGFDEKDKPWDATPTQALSHIAQLKPILQEYYDVIMVVQAGFIGSWGEWYYTENYKDTPTRKLIVDALLDAVPAERQISLRTPAFKMQLYGFSASDTLTRETAHQATIKARLGGHNDCYLATSNDQGTFSGSKDRKYWEAESPFVIMGGETCGVSAFCHCEPQADNAKARGVLADMAANHYTYINQGYHPGVISRWKSEGCFEDLQRRLGYRYVLEKGFFTKTPKAGEDFRSVLIIRNDGFAPAMNPRDAELILTDASGKEVGTWPLESDPRYWMPEEPTTVDQTFALPSGLSGEYTLWLNLPDPCSNLRGNPFYSIRLANEGVWDENTGYNKLLTITL